jgi:hypothetical protein
VQLELLCQYKAVYWLADAHSSEQMQRAAAESSAWLHPSSGTEHVLGGPGCCVAELFICSCCCWCCCWCSSGDSLTLSSESVAAEVTDELDMLRREWEALLEVAARCRDPQQQPTMLTR